MNKRGNFSALIWYTNTELLVNKYDKRYGYPPVDEIEIHLHEFQDTIKTDGKIDKIRKKKLRWPSIIV